jgi:hypothetical protein
MPTPTPTPATSMHSPNAFTADTLALARDFAIATPPCRDRGVMGFFHVATLYLVL